MPRDFRGRELGMEREEGEGERIREPEIERRREGEVATHKDGGGMKREEERGG